MQVRTVVGKDTKDFFLIHDSSSASQPATDVEPTARSIQRSRSIDVLTKSAAHRMHESTVVIPRASNMFGKKQICTSHALKPPQYPHVSQTIRLQTIKEVGMTMEFVG
jgi:hypothetical protein